MYMTTALAIFLVLQCSACRAIKVPVVWDSNSEVIKQSKPIENEAVESFVPETLQQIPIPVEYFEYHAKKPQFAVDIAKFHEVQSPENHYKAYPIRPYTGKERPDLGKHQILDRNKVIYKPFQDYTHSNQEISKEVTPVLSNYEIYHPYKAEEPALQDIYKDPVLNKIREDIRDSKTRLQNYENEAGKPDISSDEYLESLEQTDRKKFPHRNVPARFEIHRPQKRPIYYRYNPTYHNRDHILNKKFKHPWNQNYAKVRPVQYRPLKNHLGKLRQHHAIKFDDEHNEYPQLPPPQQYEEPSDGYDIYERGQAKYAQLRNNVDESINKVVQRNRPVVYEKLELQSNGNNREEETTEEDDEFIPVKNYAQVRKTETKKFLPKEAALQDADSYEEILNAPRLKEAVKSSKAQTVYTEEGYEDAAYDHAGEQKHASDHEGHGGYLKEKEISVGKYKTPTFKTKHDDATGSQYRDQLVHGEKWKNSDKENEKEYKLEDYSEDEQEESIETDIYQDNPQLDDEIERNKRESDKQSIAEKSNNDSLQHEVNKREAKFKVPEINLNTTYLNEDDIIKTAKLKLEPKKDNIKEKYPYYFKNLKYIHKHSPLRYAENLKLIPKKSQGGTEFYDSKSNIECPEVDEEIDPVPENLKIGNPNDQNSEEAENIKSKKNDHIKQQPRLKGLGDKIDCFKAKYFGENPLDSPFFKEEIISNPEPIILPSSNIFKLNKTSRKHSNEPKFFDPFDFFKTKSQIGLFTLLDSHRQKNNTHKVSDVRIENSISQQIPKIIQRINTVNIANQSTVQDTDSINITSSQNSEEPGTNMPYTHFMKNEDVTMPPSSVRRKRSAPFVYEPYKIIRDSQVQDSRKTTTTSNISPLIKQLQSSNVVDKVTKISFDGQPVKRNVNRTYKDIGRKDREEKTSNQSEEAPDPHFVDVNVDQRRGEPRYELRPTNHKSKYTPVENKKSMSREDYKAQIRNNNTIEALKQEYNGYITLPTVPSQQKSRQRRPTVRPYFDVSKFLPTTETQKASASNTQKVIATTPISRSKTKLILESNIKNQQKPQSNESEEDYEEYEDYDDEETTSPTITTTLRPIFRIKLKPTSASARKEVSEEPTKLQLVTRFRDTVTSERTTTEKSHAKSTKSYLLDNKDYKNEDIHIPKYREKKRKSTESTLVTDSKSYGDGKDDMRKDEVDAMIGIKQDMDDFIPLYEKEIENKKKNLAQSNESSEEGDEEYDDDNEEDDEEEDDEDDNDEDEDDNNRDNEDDDDEEENNNGTKEESAQSNQKSPKFDITTAEPTKRTLLKTTETPVPTVEVRSVKLDESPIVMKKKIEIHKELPVNKTSPHVTQFKQDIKEVEIIKEMPRKSSRRKPQKNLEALDLYKDENLAKDVNMLGGVEIFRDDLDLVKGPKHGGNYKMAIIAEKDLQSSTVQPILEKISATKEDTDTSQSQNKKLVKMDDVDSYATLHGDNLRSLKKLNSQNNDRQNAEFVELIFANDKLKNIAMHGGNLRSIEEVKRKRGGNRNAKLIELVDDVGNDENNPNASEEDQKSNGYSTNRGSLHGGNYRSAKIIQPNDDIYKRELTKKSKTNSQSQGARTKAAVLLNSFAQAVPILTTTPAYILDPSKRMYYYVDA